MILSSIPSLDFVLAALIAMTICFIISVVREHMSSTNATNYQALYEQCMADKNTTPPATAMFIR